MQYLNALTAILPVVILLGTGLVLLMLEVFSLGKDRQWAANFSLVGLGIALYFALRGIGGEPQALFAGPGKAAPIMADAFGHLASAVMLAAGFVAVLFSPEYIKNARCSSGEYYALILFSIVGMIVMAMAGDLITFFLGLEVMSIGVYVLTGIRRNDLRASEAALKYLLMGAFATGFLLMGIAFIYGAAGTVALPQLARHMAAPVGGQAILITGLVLVLIGVGFKVAAVPFHLWAPDVYEGAPTPITGFMAVGVKAAAFVALVRIVAVGFANAEESAAVIPFISLIAYLTIIVGNLLAIVQRNVKRMLAYSSVSHAGYALIGVVALARGEETAGAAVLFYLTAYTFMTLGAFGVLAFLERKDGGAESERFGAFAGMGYKHPALGMAMSVFMIALAGMPPTGGFFGKLYIFSAAINAGELGLVFAGIAGSLISVYYYLRVIVSFYMVDVPDAGPLPSATRSKHLTAGLIIATAAVITLGIFPNQWIELGKLAIKSLNVG